VTQAHFHVHVDHALGLSLILNLSNVIDFAHGGFLVIGGYIAFTITPYLGFWGALLIAPPLTALMGLVVERVMRAKPRDRSVWGLAGTRRRS
jgi:branched-subunit amino acid ABC-type transport system permease component